MSTLALLTLGAGEEKKKGEERQSRGEEESVEIVNLSPEQNRTARRKGAAFESGFIC